EAHLGRSTYRNHARRVVEGQRLMQAASDLFLGWTHDNTSDVDYYWRNLRDMKASADINGQPTNTFLAYAELCGVTLARAHARTRGRRRGHLRLPGQGRRLRQGAGQLRGRMCRPERARPRGARRSHPGRPAAGRVERVDRD